jgi:hypothetical protein
MHYSLKRKVKSLSYNHRFSTLPWSRGEMQRVFAVVPSSLSYFYRLRRALSFACHAFYAVLLSRRIRLLFRNRVPRRVPPIEHCHGADFQADAVSSANVPINCNNCSMNTELLWRFNRPPNVVTLMFTNDLAILLKIWVYRQDCFTYQQDRRWKYNPFAVIG